jgi:hypothetical protein
MDTVTLAGDAVAAMVRAAERALGVADLRLAIIGGMAVTCRLGGVHRATGDVDVVADEVVGVAVESGAQLLVDAGISFFFTTPEGEKETKMIITDSPTASEPREKPLHFLSSPSMAEKSEYITDVSIAHNVRPGRAVVRDFDFRRPTFPLAGSHSDDDDEGRDGEQDRRGTHDSNHRATLTQPSSRRSNPGARAILAGWGASAKHRQRRVGAWLRWLTA